MTIGDYEGRGEEGVIYNLCKPIPKMNNRHAVLGNEMIRDDLRQIVPYALSLSLFN